MSFATHSKQVEILDDLNKRHRADETAVLRGDEETFRLRLETAILFWKLGGSSCEELVKRAKKNGAADAPRPKQTDEHWLAPGLTGVNLNELSGDEKARMSDRMSALADVMIVAAWKAEPLGGITSEAVTVDVLADQFPKPRQQAVRKAKKDRAAGLDRYIWSLGDGYFIADFTTEGVQFIRDGRRSGNLAPKCRGVRTSGATDAPQRSSISRAELFTVAGLSDPENLQRAGCSDVIAARYTLMCAATVLNGMPNASAAPQIRQSLESAEQESARRCSAQSHRVGAAGDAIVQQEIGRVYQTVAGQAVYGGDVSEMIISQCARSVVGSLAGAGLIR